MKNICMIVSLVMLMPVQISAMGSQVGVKDAPAQALKVNSSLSDAHKALKKLRLDLDSFLTKVQHKNEAAIIRADVSALIKAWNELATRGELPDAHNLKKKALKWDLYGKVMRSARLAEFISKASCYITYRDQENLATDGELLIAWDDLMKLFKQIVGFPEISQKWKEGVEAWLKENYEILTK